MAPPRTPERVPLWGDALCLDYANSVDWSERDEYVDPEHSDVIRTAELLGRWGDRLGLLGEGSKPADGAELRRARVLRDAVYRLFAAIARNAEPASEDLDALMKSYVDAVQHASLPAGEDAYRLDWRPGDPRRIRYAVAVDAVALLTDAGRLKRVSRCPGRRCGWLFLNTSGRRRWCSMSTCGSREKMRRLHQRRTQEAT